GKPEAEGAEPVRRRAPEADRRPAAGAGEAPAAAPAHPARAHKSIDLTRAEKSRGCEERTLAEWSAQQPHEMRSQNRPLPRIVGAPLPHIAVHVAQTQLVRRVGADTRRAPQALPLRGLAGGKVTVEVRLLGGQVVGWLVQVEVVRALFLRS